MSKEFRHIIRVAGADLDGAKKVGYALTGVKGIGIGLAKVIAQKAGVDPQIRLGFLPEANVQKIEEILKNSAKYGLPSYLLNRRKDRESGTDVHLIGPDLTLQNKTDIDEMKNTKSWKGFRHAHALKARGQRTRTTGRKAKAVGVKKKRVRIPSG